jgi:hypothetical protein
MILIPTEQCSFAASKLWVYSRAEAEASEQADFVADYAGDR